MDSDATVLSNVNSYSPFVIVVVSCSCYNNCNAILIWNKNHSSY